jgi:hypothetical protein
MISGGQCFGGLLRLVIITLIIALCGCSRPAALLQSPADQQSFESQLTQFHNQYLEARRQQNRLNQDAVEGQMRAWKAGLEGAPKEVTNWVCSIKSVNSDRKLTCTSGVVTYHINLANSEPTLLAQLGAGRIITFTGRVAKEKSLTLYGAVTEPEIVVDEASVVVH